MNWQRLQDWQTRIDALSLRERAILLLTSVLLLGYLLYLLLLRPAWQALELGAAEMQSLESQLAALTVRSQELRSGESTPEAQRRERIRALEDAVAAHETRIQTRLGRIMQPRQAAQLLQELLEQTQGLELVRLETDSGMSLFADQAEAGITRQGVGRYNLSLVMQGDYQATVRYLEKVEELPWKLFWESLEYDVDSHPNALIKLNIFTLGQV